MKHNRVILNRVFLINDCLIFHKVLELFFNLNLFNKYNEFCFKPLSDECQQ